MRRSPRLLVAAALVGVLVPTAVSQTAVSAVDQDLVLSITSGAPGAMIDVSSASCEGSIDDGTIRYLRARLVVGTAPGQVLAGTGFAVESDVASMIIPDWVDPAAPAEVAAQCIEAQFDPEDEEAEPTSTTFDYDPVAFDLEAGAGVPGQTRTYSRTELQAGQAFAVNGTGCFLDGADTAYVDVVAGADLTFAEPQTLGASSGSELDGDSFELVTAMANGGMGISVSGDDDGRPTDVEITEVPTDLPAGTYSSVSYCSNQDGTTLLYEPQLIEITGDAPFGDLDIEVPAGTDDVTLTGGSCTAGDASALVFSEDFATSFDPGLLARSPATGGSALGPAALRSRTVLRSGAVLLDPGAAGRALGGDTVEIAVTPDADGAWSYEDEAGFDSGLVGAYALCGDPLADGFLYDPRAAEVSVAETPDTTTTTTTAPAPAPANAVAGTPTYAG